MLKDKKIRVYIASPYTKGDVAVNVKRQITMANELMSLGLIPFVPLLTHFQHMIHPRPYQDWLDLDMEWLKQCNCVFRLEGESSGADLEVKEAKTLGIPIMYSINEIRTFYK